MLLTPEQWREAEPILDRALELAPRERDAFLDEACRGSPALRVRVQRLVAAADEDEFLDTAARWSAMNTLRPHAPDEPPSSQYRGRRIGPYRILEEIGRGGMGLVFLAERADGLWERRVALKLIRSELPSEGVVERFLHERRVLALLDHPDIARLLDGGATADGWPYFAMELVEGSPITEYCDRERLGIRARLELFLAACDAVQHAHDRLVIHRDLKPSNIHVTSNRQIKLLDFGVARILRPRALGPGAGGPDLESSLVPMTPEYAAPEQFGDGPVDPATDVYSLAVVLYELLAGQRPYQFGRKRPNEIERVVRTGKPLELSRAVTGPSSGWRTAGSGGTPTLDSISAARGTDPRQLKRRLRGDLELILSKALHKDRAHRYASVDAFASDIRAHLAGLPVRAHPEGWLYRARKFVGRRRVACAAALLLATSVAGGVAATARQRSLVRLEAERARGARDLLIGLLNGIPAGAMPAESAALRDILMAGTQRVESGLAGTGAEQGEMLAAFGVIFLRLGERDLGLDLLGRGLDLRSRSAPWPDSVTAAMEMRLAEALVEAGEATRAEALFHSALRTGLRLFGPGEWETARILGGLGSVAFLRGDDGTAITFYRRALELEEGRTRPDREGKARLMSGLARVLLREGRAWDAEPLQREVLRARLAAERDDGSEAVQAMLGLATVRLSTGDVESADWILEKVLEQDRRAEGAAHVRIMEARRDLAVTLLEIGGYEEAVVLLTQVLEYDRSSVGPENERTAETQSRLAAAYLGAGLLDRAEQAARAVVAAGSANRRADGQGVGVGRALLAETLLEAGRIGEAEREFLGALEVLDRPGDRSPPLAATLLGLGGLLADQARCT
ncbi:MAG TPA: serine/threonine-protein kinase, partial [Longimicrobiales bacterium]|nr:serine/threonine-protein kinase [Longimicrobiales bacterium]